MLALGLAVLLGLVAFPFVLVYGPAYSPWSVLVLVAFGGAIGMAVPPRGQRLPRALGLAAVWVAIVLGVLMLTSNLSFLTSNSAVLLSLVLWIGSLLLPVFVGVAAGATLRARWGTGPAAAVGVLGLFAATLLGAGLAFAFAPAEVASAPHCSGGHECPRVWCAQMAERRRTLAVERVIAFDGNRITCNYTGWGGIDIGRADVGFPGGGSWTDGAWPRTLLGR